MTILAARQAVAAMGEAARVAWAGSWVLKVQYDNRNLVDVSTQTDPYVSIETVFLGGHQADLNPQPLVAQYGQIVVTALAKVGSGSFDASRLLDHFIPYFERNDGTAIRTRAGVAQKCFEKSGWEGFPVLIPFYYHRVAT